MTAPRALLLAALLLSPLAALGETSVWPTKRSPDPEWGQDLYDKHCWQCHGRQAQGDGPVAASMKVPVPTLRGRSDDAARPDLVTLVRQGRGPMPSYQDSISRQDVRRIFVYIESLDDPDRPIAVDDDEDEAPVPEGDAPAAEGNEPEGGE